MRSDRAPGIALAILFATITMRATSAAPRFSHVALASRTSAAVAAEELWRGAETERDVSAQPGAWRAASEAFLAIAETKAEAASIRLAAVRAGWAAQRNATEADLKANPQKTTDTTSFKPVPRPISTADLRLMHAAELYAQLDPGAAEAVLATYLRARVLWRYDHLDEATVVFVEIVDHHPKHEVAEYAANLALDSLNRLERYDELVALAERLYADHAFYADRPELAGRLLLLHQRIGRMAAAACSSAADRSREFAEYERCGEAYLALADANPSDGDELLYNAQVSFEAAAAFSRVREVAHRFAVSYPRSRLYGRSLARLARAESAIGLFAEAATTLEQYFTRFEGERDAPDAIADAIVFRIGLGELDHATRDVAALAKHHHDTEPLLATSTALLGEAYRVVGQRRDAVRVARTLDPRQAPLAAGQLFAALACPVEVVDEMCPQPRDPAWLARARAVLERLTEIDDPAHVGRRLLESLDRESANGSRAVVSPPPRELHVARTLGFDPVIAK